LYTPGIREEISNHLSCKSIINLINTNTAQRQIYFETLNKSNQTANQTKLYVAFLESDNTSEIRSQIYSNACKIFTKLQEAKRKFEEYQDNLKLIAESPEVRKQVMNQGSTMLLESYDSSYSENEVEYKYATEIIMRRYIPDVFLINDAEFIVNRMFYYLTKTSGGHYSDGKNQKYTTSIPLLFNNKDHRIYNIFVFEDDDIQYILKSPGTFMTKYEDKLVSIHPYYDLVSNEEVKIPYTKKDKLFRLDLDLTKIPM
jgi:hypothetical protein